LGSSFIEELRNHRLSRKISLEDIAAGTRINIKFLRAIEEGNFEILPQPYVRAFLKEYARQVDYDPEKLLQQFDEHVQPESGERTEPASIITEVPSTGSVSDSPHLPRMKFVSLSLIAFGVIALVVYYTMFRPDAENTEVVTARPFQEVVREIEEQAEESPIAMIDSPSNIQQTFADSLELEITATDTVWLTVMIDNIEQREYILQPNNRIRWQAANQFLLTVGNAGGISVRVNGDTLGTLGRQGEVIRNLTITREGIQR
jgi:cytoskeleton protein RodZ